MWGGGGGGIIRLDSFKGHSLCILGSFIKVKVQNLNIFDGLLKFEISFGERSMLGLNIHRPVTDIQVNVYIGNTLSRLSFQN